MFIILLNNAFCQTFDWTWIHGDSTTHMNGIYGDIGVANINNKPGSRQGATSWTDTNGNLWLFGGLGLATTSTVGYLNDLWKFNPLTAEWTWVNGDSLTDVNGLYGQREVYNSNNKPGGRQNTGYCIDTSGIFWLFGGIGLNSQGGTGGWQNDLWKYNPLTNQWAWMHGDSTLPIGYYGIIGVSDANNKPTPRHERPVAWCDNDNQIFIFGGWGYNESGSNWGALNDLWRFNQTTNEWTWVKGDNVVDASAHNGIQGVPDILNKPIARNQAIGWKDNNGYLWMFGGLTYDVYGGYNDLWKYDPLSNIWTWIKGDTTFFVNGIYGTQGIPNIQNCPGSRYASVTWTGNDNNLWLFGGYGYGITMSQDFLNDLWKYNISTNEWTWIKGDIITGVTGVYGNLGIPNPNNKPGCRGFASSWTDINGNFWLFGGNTFNDLWGYNILPTNILPTINTQFSIFPNPTTGKVTITAKNINRIEVLDIHGREVYKGKNNEIDLSQEPQGIYIIKITTDKQTITRKIIKQ